MKIIFPILFLILFSVSSSNTSEYNADYCHDPAELQKWEKLLTDNPGSEPLAAIHALWIGLCIKVEARQLTTTRANQIFERFRDALINEIRQQQESAADRKKSPIHRGT